MAGGQELNSADIDHKDCNIMGELSLKVSVMIFCFIKCWLPLKVVSDQKLSSFKCCLPSKVVFFQRLSSIEGCLPSKDVLQ